MLWTEIEIHEESGYQPDQFLEHEPPQLTGS